MTKEELLKQCRYYKGENTAPAFEDGNMGALWFYEKHWVDELASGASFATEMQEHETYPVQKIDTEDKVPYSLKSVLFNRYCKTAMGTRKEIADGFERLLKKYY